jgi:beta-fructofuranosidase
MKNPARFGATRRQFITSAAALVVAPRTLLSESEPVVARLASDPRRPQFHLLPARNWMNDPNGPIFFNGKYHMFFQYNPHAAVWGDMSWYHSVSPDMIHWTHLPVAFVPTPGGPDSAGCFSGSAIAIGKRVYVVYTGVVESGPDQATIRDGSNKLKESQCLAFSDDPNLILWEKIPTPIVPKPPDGLAITGFRDPSAWRQGDVYYMTVGSGIAQSGGCVLLYRSKDLKTWEYLHPLISGTWSGKKTTNPCDDGEMWECPEFFALDGMHVLIYSTLGKVFWQSGRLDARRMKFTPVKTGLLDLDAFYAPKAQLDAHGRRILWGWIPERRNDTAMREAGWSGMMSLPRLMRLDPDGLLRLKVLPEIIGLRAGSLPADKVTTGESRTLLSANGEILCAGGSGKSFEVSVTTGKGELIHITYLSEKHSFLADGHEIVLQPRDQPTLHAFVDGSVIEMIFGERIGYTKRFYYEGTTAPDVRVHAIGSGVITMDAWKVRSISGDRLTTARTA